MVHLPYGSHSAHVNTSSGPDSHLMKFYVTEYSTNMGIDGYTPRPGKHTGTGYQSNFSPGVYYSGKLDELDNPKIGQLVKGNYLSRTHKDFVPYKGSIGREPLPRELYYAGSGFTRETPIHNPTGDQARSLYVNTRHSAPGPILPRHLALLHKLQPKDPISAESSGHGPRYMSTECHTRFNTEPLPKKGFRSKKLGGKEETGFTHAFNDEPITFYPGTPHTGDLPGWVTHRPTGYSVMKGDFIPYGQLDGRENLPVSIADGSERDTGYTREVAKPLYVHRNPADAYANYGDVHPMARDHMKKNDPCDYLNLIHPDNHTSVTKNLFRGQQLPNKSESDRLARTHPGWKELSGYSGNNTSSTGKAMEHGPDDPRRFITHYDTRFYDMNPQGKAREGRTFGAVMTQKPNGYTKSTQVHSFGAQVNTTDELRDLNPYVARSVKAGDPYYDDHTHDPNNYSFRQPEPSKDILNKPAMNMQRPRLENRSFDTGVRVGSPRQTVLQHWAVACPTI